MRRSWILVSVIVGTAAASAVVVHVPQVRRALGVRDACPVLHGADLEKARKQALAPLAGSAPSPTHSALGFVVGAESRAAVRKWADAQGVACSDVDGVALRCAGATGILAIPADAFFRFDADRLVGVDALARAADLGAYRDARKSLSASFGPPHDDTGSEALAQAPAGRVASRWRFADLAIDVSAFSIGDGLRVRLQLRALQ